MVAAIAALIICGGLIAIYAVTIHRPYEVLFSNLRPADAATIVAELDKKKVSYRLKDGGQTILAPANTIPATRLGVINADLPLKGAVGFELFNKSDIGLTEFAQKINYQRALQGELARTIMSMEGVDSARVHLSVPETTIFREDRKAPKASVTVLPRQGQGLTPGMVWGIQKLVSAAVPELETANVVVLDEHGSVVSGQSDATETAPVSSTGQEREAIRQYYQARARRAVEGIAPGLQIDVSVDIAPKGAVSETSLDQWSPTARTFPLRFVISATPALSADQQVFATAAVQRDIGRPVGAVDEILFGAVALPPSGPVSAPLLPVAPTPAIEPVRPSSTPSPGKANVLWWSLVIAAISLGMIALVLLRRRRAPGGKSLSERERKIYASRLRRLLDRETLHAASR